MTQRDQYKETDIAASLRASGGDVGGWRDANFIYYTDTVGSLCQDDYKGPNKQYVEQGKLIICLIKQ